METRKTDQRQIGGIQHQLQRHENDNNIPSEQDPGEPDSEQQPANYQIIIKSGHSYFNSLLLSRTAPTVATTTNAPIICNGSLYCWKSAIPTSQVSPCPSEWSAGKTALPPWNP